MPFDTRIQVIQNRLVQGGFSVGKAGADGFWGDDTYLALMKALDAAEIGLLSEAPDTDPAAVNSGPIPTAWLDSAKMARIICHWTAGSYSVSEIDKEHYHFIIGGDGVPVRGDHAVMDNVNTADGDYAAHTLNCNTGSIGISLACMAGAVESPFNPGPYPMRQGQWDVLVRAVAQLCQHYKIAVTPKTVLSHAEVQGTLGITQRGKWDYTRLPFIPTVTGAVNVGNMLRAEVSAYLKG